MPDEVVRRYRVTETRETIVTAQSPAHAVREADLWFSSGSQGGIDGIPEIRVTDISARED
jgi:hypothetical protein